MKTEPTKKKPRGKPFAKGQSGNPGGRPKEDPELKELARAHTVEAIERLVFWMRSKNPKASVTAAQAILDRGHGKPVQMNMVKGDGEGGAVKLLIIGS